MEAIEDVSVKEHCSVNHVSDTYQDINNKSKSYVTDSCGSTLGSKNDLLVSVPTTRDLDTITTADSQQKVKDECLSSLPPISGAGGGTLVTQNHLQNFQQNIFLPTNSDGHEWCDSSEYGYSKFASGYRGERIDPTLEFKYRALERENEENERGTKEAERLLDDKVKQLQLEVERNKEKHKKHMEQAKERYREQLELHRERYNQQWQIYKEKLEEAKEKLHDARQMQISTEQSAKQMEKLNEIRRSSCIIQ